jgi:poly(beta-D-mannuronate) lyase
VRYYPDNANDAEFTRMSNRHERGPAACRAAGHASVFRRQPALLLGVSLLMTSQAVLAASTCPVDAPVAQVQSQGIYADASGSRLDADKLRASLALVAPLRRFVADASLRADSTNPADETCAYAMMLSWAKSGAMLVEPANFAGMRERERFTIALNIIALKLKAEGFAAAPLLEWLGRLNNGVIDDFEKRGLEDNLGVWSGVAAASYALLSGDGRARRYAGAVWNRAISGIRPDGYIDTELRRAGRALDYHTYYLSALVTLHAFREALGDSASQAEQAGLKRLAGKVADALCDPSAMSQAAGGAPQQALRPIAFSPIISFGRFLGLQPAGRCAPQDVPPNDPILGGSFAKTAALLARPPH